MSKQNADYAEGANEVAAGVLGAYELGLDRKLGQGVWRNRATVAEVGRRYNRQVPEAEGVHHARCSAARSASERLQSWAGKPGAGTPREFLLDAASWNPLRERHLGRKGRSGGRAFGDLHRARGPGVLGRAKDARGVQVGP